MEKLKFLETMTVEEFKSKMSVNKIEVKQNPYTGKCFFVTNPVISQVCSPDTGDMFYMLHQKGDGGAPTLATL